MTKFGDMLRRARKAKALRKQLAYIPLTALWPKKEVDPDEKVPASLRRYRNERRLRNRRASHSRARNRG